MPIKEIEKRLKDRMDKIGETLSVSVRSRTATEYEYQRGMYNGLAEALRMVKEES